MGFKDFKDLDVWKLGRELRQEVMLLADAFPAEERYRLADQIIRSSRSITNNVAEGHGRYHYQENIQFCRIARGSLSETDDHLLIALECDYLSIDKYKEYEEKILALRKKLNGYIAYLERSKAESNHSQISTNKLKT